ncbi:MAG: Gfo/Idh/MocA family oxidoreductase [Planctomycetia bacterium]|nr:Gfo/Idh/MocA family oxidoreductase [Planctomycetia bacterium]
MTDETPNQADRRQFLQAASLGAAAAAVTAGYTATARGFAANETITVGLIGTGGRCRHLLQALLRVPGVKVNAVCDVWDVHLDMARKAVGGDPFSTKDHRAILDRKDVDAVLVATPDHWHVPITIDACAAGKDVYVEKPLTHELSEGQAAIDAQNKHGRIVQVGMQQRSMPQFQQAFDIVRSGQLGKIHKVHLTWNRNTPRGQDRHPDVAPNSVDWKRFLGNAPDQPFDAYRFRNWRWFWDFGGGILTDLMVHFLDVANWYLELDHPDMACSIGDQFRSAGLWQTPDTVQTLLHYPEKGAQVYYEGTFINARNAAMLEFMGTDATLYLDRGRYEVIPERNSKVKPSELVLSDGPRGADFYLNPDGELLHLTNWIECVRSRQKPNAPAEAGVIAVKGAHLGNRALRSGQVARWEST